MVAGVLRVPSSQGAGCEQDAGRDLTKTPLLSQPHRRDNALITILRSCGLRPCVQSRLPAGPLTGGAPERDSLLVRPVYDDPRRWPMSAMTSTPHRSLGRPAAVVLGVLAAALLSGYALGVGASHDPRYFWASLISGVPVALLVILVAERWPRSAALALVGLVAFSGALAVKAARSASPEPLLVAVACVLMAGGVLVVAGRARWLDVLGGLLLTYASAAFLFEVSIVLHNL